jgi:putative FmdB family regulatory protein
MPMYEFVCPACRTYFDELRPAREADDTAWCPVCDSVAVRKLSRFTFKKSAEAERHAAVPPISASAHGSGCACCQPSRP